MESEQPTFDARDGLPWGSKASLEKETTFRNSQQLGVDQLSWGLGPQPESMPFPSVQQLGSAQLPMESVPAQPESVPSPCMQRLDPIQLPIRSVPRPKSVPSSGSRQLTPDDLPELPNLQDVLHLRVVLDLQDGLDLQDILDLPDIPNPPVEGTPPSSSQQLDPIQLPIRSVAQPESMPSSGPRQLTIDDLLNVPNPPVEGTPSSSSQQLTPDHLPELPNLQDARDLPDVSSSPAECTPSSSSQQFTPDHLSDVPNSPVESRPSSSSRQLTIDELLDAPAEDMPPSSSHQFVPVSQPRVPIPPSPRKRIPVEPGTKRERERAARFAAAGLEPRSRIIKACSRCREKKIKCSRHRPQCKACQRKSLACVYHYGNASEPEPSASRAAGARGSSDGRES